MNIAVKIVTDIIIVHVSKNIYDVVKPVIYSGAKKLIRTVIYSLSIKHFNN